MLQSLHIKDFILIEKLDLEFSEGFCVITGGTGAGKSILLDSILFCLGGKISGDPIRPGANSCSITVVFSECSRASEYLESVGIEVDNEIIVKRIQSAPGRKKFLINDQIVTAKIMQNLFDYLLELHGQHNHTLLLRPSSHMDILDNYGALSALKGEVSSNYKIWQDFECSIEEFDKEKEKLEKEIEYLSHICKELEKAQIELGEEEELAGIKKDLQNRDKEIKLIQSVLSEIKKSSIEQIIGRSQRSMSASTSPDRLEKVNDRLEQAYDMIEYAKADLAQILCEFEDNFHSLEEVDDRLYEIRTLARKHSCSPSELLEFLEVSTKKLTSLEGKFKDSSSLQSHAIEAKSSYLVSAKKLSTARLKSSKELEKKTTSELGSLEMKKASFQVDVESSESFASVSGQDYVRFVASTNPGMKPAPIDKIASGGELSRFMLALRVALFDKAPKQSIIFDEIDVGISGSAADSMGERLKSLSKAVQIIVITHQPQVAGKADQHILVKKQQHDTHTVVQIKELQSDEKSLELARMISGKEITKTGLEAAKELMT